MSADWTTVIVGAVTASAAIAGSIGAQVVATRAAGRATRQVHDEQRWASKRDAIVALLAKAALVDSLSSGAVAGRRLIDKNDHVAQPFLEAIATAEIQVSADAWVGMKPYLDAISMRANAVSSLLDEVQRRELIDQIEERGVNELGGMETRRKAFIGAVRSELAR